MLLVCFSAGLAVFSAIYLVSPSLSSGVDESAASWLTYYQFFSEITGAQAEGVNKNLYSFGALLAALAASLLLATSPAPFASASTGSQGFGKTVNLAQLAGEIGYYQWPSRHRVQILRPFDPPSSPWGSGHRGVDLAMPAGSEIFSAREGTVFFVGTIAGKPSISIKHSELIRTTYTPVKSDLKVGATVTTGQKIGTLEAGHPGLHFGVKIDDRHYLNPLLLILGPIRLLPDP